MNPKIYHETVDKRIIEYLSAIGHRDFYETVNKDNQSKEFYIDLFFNEKFEYLFPNTSNAVWKVEVQFVVEYKMNYEISKDREFYALNLKTGKPIELSIFHRSETYKGLQSDFETWLASDDRDLEEDIFDHVKGCIL